ncbi:MAG TPA: universal stress protein [Terriglobia bacterium]|nr:universal stress protein [Terriglobia bacterium]
MLSNIVVASDGCEASDRMVECVKGLQRVGSQQAVLVHVFNVRDVGGLYASLQEYMLPKLEKQAEVLRQAGFQVEVQTPLGFPAYEINKLARERSASLVVVGSHGASMAKDRLLGSTAQALLYHLTFPTLLVRFEITEENGGRRCRVICEDMFQHILFPTDFSDNAELALLYLEHIVRETKSHVTLLHVQDKTKIEKHLKHRLEEFNEIDAERLEGMKARIEQCGAASVETEIPYGSPTQIILERARSNSFSLILMGSQGKGFIQEVFLGSVANNVARLAPLPVLFIPAPGTHESPHGL